MHLVGPSLGSRAPPSARRNTPSLLLAAPWLNILYALSALCRQWLQRTPLRWKSFGLGVVLALWQFGLKPKLGLCVLSMRLDMKHVAGGPYALTPEHPSLPSPEQLGGVPEFMFLCCVVFLQRLLPFFRPCFLIPVSVKKSAIP